MGLHIRCSARLASVGVGIVASFFLSAAPAAAQDWVPYGEASRSAHVVSPEVRTMPDAASQVSSHNQTPIQHRPDFVPHPGPTTPDPVLQTSPGTTAAPAAVTGFDGVAFNGYYPPDANSSVSLTQVVQTTNVMLAVYNKTGGLLKGPVALSTFFSGLGNLCDTTDGGDPVVLWDKIAHRWVITQIAYNQNYTTNYQCIAVSQTDDALGAFNLYSFAFSHLPDYPKFGVWSSSDPNNTSGSDYYMSANMFSTALYFGPVVCAFNGHDMQTGAAARFACAQGTIEHFSLLPSDHDGATPPAPGEPNYFVELGSTNPSTTLNMFSFLATWTANSGSLNSPATIALTVPGYSLACGNGGACIPQAGTTTKLDSLGDRLMYRLSFRKIGDHESLLLNHSVDQGSGVTGIRWYEFRSNSNQTLAQSRSLFQRGTYGGQDANNNHRWMGSIAQDNQGNIAVGYSASGTLVYPSIRYAGRVPGDPLNTLGLENDILQGNGSETSANRWGDYTSLSLDPSDDCTFWYTNEYILPTGGVSWRTRIASFRFPTCGSGGIVKTNTATALSSSLNPSNVGDPVTFTATVSPSSGTTAPTGTVTFAADGNTLGTGTLDGAGQARFTTSSLTAGSSSMTASYGGDAAFNSSSSAVLTQTVNTVTTGGFTLAIDPTTPTPQTVIRPGYATFKILVSRTGGFSAPVTFSSKGAPPQSAAIFQPNPASADSTVFTVQLGRNTPKRSYTITITGSGGPVSASTTVTVIVQ